MAQQTITGGNGTTGQTGEQVKDIINENFTEVYGASSAAQTSANTANADLATHIADTVAAHAGSAISISPFGSIGATDVQSALEEIATEIGASVPDASETVKGIAELATQAETNTGSDDSRIVTSLKLHTKVVGVQDLFIPATGMWPRVTSGCSPLAQSEMTTSLFNIQSLDFNHTTQQYAQFQITLPRNWNNGTITFVPYWTAASGSGTVVWTLQGGAYSNDDALTVALGTAQSSTDTLITANDLHTGPESSAITLAGSPADADFLAFQISRDTGSDTLSADAKLLGISIRLTTDAGKAA